MKLGVLPGEDRFRDTVTYYDGEDGAGVRAAAASGSV
jgi:hypothetical protein